MIPIAYMVLVGKGYMLACLRCASNIPSEMLGAAVCRENVYPYKGTCAACHRLIVEPQTPAWPELFDGGRDVLDADKQEFARRNAGCVC